jgi:hypothetical protein
MIFLSIIFALILVPCLAQKKADNEVIIEKSKTFNVKDYEGWQKISIDEFSFYVPKDFKLEKKMGIDLECWEHETDSVHLKIYSGARFPEHSYSIKQRSTFNEKSLYINDIFTDIASYEYESRYYPYKYIDTARFYIDKQTNETGMIIYLASKDSAKELVEKIFLSVKLKDASVTKTKKK